MPQHASESKALSIVAHLAALFTSFVVSVLGPILILVVSEDVTVKNNARESLNFQLTMLIYALISIPLCFVVVGFFTLFIVGIWSIVAPIIAMIRVDENPATAYRYKGIIHFLKSK